MDATQNQPPAPAAAPQVNGLPPKPQPEQMIAEWQSPSRPYKQRNRQYYFTVAAIMILILLILGFAGQFLLIAVVFALGFIAYASAAVPPDMVSHQITTYGIRTGDHLYPWDQLGRFWFETKFQQNLVKIESAGFPNQIMLMLGEVTPEQMTEILGEVLLNEKPPLTTFEKSAQWLQEQVPLDPEA